MNLPMMAADGAMPRAFIDEVGYDITRDTLSVLLRAAGSFVGGIALTSLFAALVR
jgi:hypothetical protein